MADSIVFIDVEKADQALVSAALPEARFVAPPKSAEELTTQCRDAVVISTFITTQFTREVLAGLPNLKLLVTRSVGYDHIDLATCAERGITVCNVPDYGSHVIAEHVFALLLSTLRHIPEGGKRVERGLFDYHGLRGIALKDKTIGIVGTGKIGRRVARIAHGFDMRILATDQCRTLELETAYGVQYVPLATLLAQSNIITLHMPATPETEHVIDASAFALMKKGAVLVNTARGSLIDSAALLQALMNGTLSHALLDVLEHEQNFAENKALINHPNVVTTPHIAFYADDSMRNMLTDCLQSITEWQRGSTPAHVVHPVSIVCDLPGVKKP